MSSTHTCRSRSNEWRLYHTRRKKVSTTPSVLFLNLPRRCQKMVDVSPTPDWSKCRRFRRFHILNISQSLGTGMIHVVVQYAITGGLDDVSTRTSRADFPARKHRRHRVKLTRTPRASPIVVMKMSFAAILLLLLLPLIRRSSAAGDDAIEGMIRC